MNIQSIPAAVMAGICFYVGTYHLIVYIRRPRNRQDFTFALTSFSIGFYDIFCAGLYSVASPEIGVQWQRAQIMALSLASTSFIWFVTDYTRQTSRKWVFALSGCYIVSGLIASIDRSGLAWTGEPAVKMISLPFGMEVTYFEMTPGPVMDFTSLLGPVLFGYSLWAGIRMYKFGEKNKAIPLIIAIAIFFVGVFNDSAVASGLFQFVYVIEYAFLAMVLFMAYALSGEIVKSLDFQEALQKSEERYRLIAENAADVIWKMNKELRFIYISPSVYQQRGYTVDEAMEHSLNEIVSPGSVEKVLNLYKEKTQLIEAGDPDGWTPAVFEVEQCCKDGTTIWTSNNARILPGPDKQPEIILGITRDITEQRNAEKKLLESEERLRNTFVYAPVGVVVADFDGRFLEVNQSFCNIVGYSKDELLKMTLNEITHSEDIEKNLKEIKKMVEGDSESFQLTKRYIHKNGEIKWVNLNVSPILDNSGKPQHLIGQIIDITQGKEEEGKRKKLEEQLQQSQKLEAIGTLAGGIAHDFNNILSAIFAFTQLSQKKLAKVPENETVFKYLEKVRSASNRAKELIDQILTISRKGEHVPKNIDLVPMVKEVMKFLRASIPSTIQIDINFSPDLNLIFGDPPQIHQIIMNLCTNASHAMESKGGTLGVHLSNFKIAQKSIETGDLEPGDYVMIKVSDTGTGMEERIRSRVFDPYFTTKEKGKGTGLGLSIVHGIVERHGGYIYVYSTPDVGTNFHVYLPASTGKTEKMEEKEYTDLPTGTEHILLVDDEPDILKSYSEMLELQGYQTTQCINGPEALTMLSNEPEKYDLVLTDYTMPQMTGIVLASEVHKQIPTMPIILMSGLGQLISNKDLKSAGITARYSKPVDYEILIRGVRKALDKSK